MAPLKDTLPPAGYRVFYVFYTFDTSQNTEYADEAKLHVPNLVSVQQFCSRYEEVEDGCDSLRSGTRKHSLLQDTVWELLSYLTEPRPWTNKIIALAHNAKAFELHFILDTAILLKWKSDLIMNGLNIMCIRMEHLVLRKLSEALGLTASKSWYPHYFNTEGNLEYIGPLPHVSYYGVNEMVKAEE